MSDGVHVSDRPVWANEPFQLATQRIVVYIIQCWVYRPPLPFASVSPNSRTWILTSHTLFDGKNSEGIFDDRVHLAELVALLGPPPPEFRKLSKLSTVFWDGYGMFLPTYFRRYSICE